MRHLVQLHNGNAHDTQRKNNEALRMYMPHESVFERALVGRITCVGYVGLPNEYDDKFIKIHVTVVLQFIYYIHSCPSFM